MKNRRTISFGFTVVYLLATVISAYLSLTCICSQEHSDPRHTCNISCRHTPSDDMDSQHWESSCRCLHHMLADNSDLYVDSDRDRGNNPTLQLLQIVCPLLRIGFGEEAPQHERIRIPRSVPLVTCYLTAHALRGPPASSLI